MEVDHADILVVATVAVLAPLLADLSRRAKVPIVVAEIFLGIIVGPQVLGLADTDSFIEALSTFGLAFLFFLAGMEIDFERIRGAAATDGVAGWGISLVLGLAIALVLHLTGVIHATILVGLALSTTALGTLMPILRDAGILDQRFGNFVVGAGAAGEFGPVVIVSVILAFDADEPLRALLLFVFAAIVVGATLFALRARPARVVRLLETTMGTSGQLAVRLSVLLIVALAVLASEFGLDVILGAFAAGIVVGIVIRGTESHEFLGKLDAIGFGFLIPVFFIATGMDYDLDALFSNPASLALVPGLHPALPAHPRRPGDAALPRPAPGRRPGLARAVLGGGSTAPGRDHADRPRHPHDANRGRGLAGRRRDALRARLPPARAHAPPPHGARAPARALSASGPYAAGERPGSARS